MIFSLFFVQVETAERAPADRHCVCHVCNSFGSATHRFTVYTSAQYRGKGDDREAQRLTTPHSRTL